MVKEFKFPDVGEGIHEGEIVKWHVKVGDKVKEDDTLLEVETAKAIVQIPSPFTGIVLQTNGNVGETIHVGDVIVVVGEKGEKIGKAEIKPEKKVEIKRESVGVIGELKESKETLAESKILALPAVKMLAKKLGIDLAKLSGTGPSGRITIQDVKKVVGKIEPVSVPKVEDKKAPIVQEKSKDRYGEIEVIPVKGVRKVIADNMVKSLFSIPHVTHMDEADVTHLDEIRKREKAYAEKKGVHLTYLPFIIRAIIAGLKDHPLLNASFEGDKIVVKNYYNIGIAVDTPDGLIVPNIKNADKKKVLKVAKEINELADKTRARKIELADVQGGTFTITNYGAFGGINATPIINPPEVANLGIGKIIDRPVVKDGKIVIRKILPLSLSFDHRVIDGAEAARFTNTMIKYLEDPDLFLVED